LRSCMEALAHTGSECRVNITISREEWHDD
jgi:hypothetical protein